MGRTEPVAPVRDRGTGAVHGRVALSRTGPLGGTMGGGQGSEACLLVRGDKYHSRET